MEQLKGKKRAVFSDGDLELMLELIKDQADVLNNKKTNGITPQKKRKVKFSLTVTKESFLTTFLSF
jgi:hypothetical protein